MSANEQAIPHPAPAEPAAAPSLAGPAEPPAATPAESAPGAAASEPAVPPAAASADDTQHATDEPARVAAPAGHTASASAAEPEPGAAIPAAEPEPGAPATAADTAAVTACEANADTAGEGASRPGVPAVAGARDGLTATALLALLRVTFPTNAARSWVAWLDTLGPITAGVPTDLGRWSEGRAWDAHAELRWQPAGADHYRALYLGDGETLPEGFQPLTAGLRALPGAAAEGLVLWGTRGADGQYREPRLPRPLDYAALGAAGPVARLPCRLLVGADGQVRFIRLAAAPEGA